MCIVSYKILNIFHPTGFNRIDPLKIARVPQVFSKSLYKNVISMILEDTFECFLFCNHFAYKRFMVYITMQTCRLKKTI